MLSDEYLVLQCNFGLKQTHAGHCSPPWCFLLVLDEELHLVRHVLVYLTAMSSLRSSEALFVTMIPPHGAAARVTLRQWFASVLRGATVDAAPGSLPAAVASTLLAQGLSDNAIMSFADWASARVLYANYLRILPMEALRWG